MFLPMGTIDQLQPLAFSVEAVSAAAREAKLDQHYNTTTALSKLFRTL
jgi:hypothetical protein